MVAKKKMLIIANNMSPTGVPAVYMSIVRSLQNEYVFDIVLNNDNDFYYRDEFLKYGGRIFVNKTIKPNKLLNKVAWFLFVQKKQTYSFIKNNLKLNDYIAIHSFNEVFSYPYFARAKKAGVKKIILYLLSASRAYKLKRNIKTLFVEMYRKSSLKLCSSIACISKETLKYNNYKGKGVVFYPSVSTNKIGPIKKCLHDDLVLLQVASFSERKNQLFSLNVIKAIKERYKNAKLLLVGERFGNEYEQKIDDFIRLNNLSKNVLFLGPDLDKYNLNEKVSYVLYPSTMESFGLVIIDSQMAGIHCFASNTLPTDTDLGNVDFIPLNVRIWCDHILDYFQRNGNERREPIGHAKFSDEEFKKNLLKIST